MASQIIAPHFVEKTLNCSTRPHLRAYLRAHLKSLEVGGRGIIKSYLLVKLIHLSLT